MLSEASEIPPNQNTVKSPNLLPHAALQSGAQRRFANRLCCAAAAWQLMRSTLGNPPSTYG